MSTGLREITQGDIQTALERILTPRLVGLVGRRQPGHCARVTDAEASLAVRLCERVRATVGNGAQVLVLGTPPAVPAEVAVTSTKLVELRNPDATGELRPPLLVFVPPGTHASAEDSFGVATFEEVPLGEVYEDLAARLLAELPPDLRRGIEDILATIEEEKWPLATSYARARFLLTLQLNDNDPEVVGAAFFELGLVPDLTLFADPALLRTRTGQNVRQMRVLGRPDRPERQRVVELGLTDVTFRQKLAKLVAETGLDDLHQWARRIVVDRANWPLSFGNWPLRASTETEAIKLTVGELVLPRVGDKPEHADHPLLANLDGQLFLLSGPQGTNQFAVAFEVQSDPGQIPALARFSAQIVSEDSGPTGVVKSVKPATTGRTGYKVTFTKLRGAGLEQGWHFVRILPQDHDGIALPVVTDDTGPHQPYESERFLVVAQHPDDGDIIEALPPDKTEIHAGVTQALRALEFRALADGRDWRTVQCRSVDWEGPQQAGRDTLRAAFGLHGAADIPLSPVLRDIQRETLADPGRAGRWTMRVVGGESVAPIPHELDSSSFAGAVTNFRAARAAALRAIRGDDDLIVEGCDLRALRAVAQTYAEAYRELLAWQLRQAERGDETQRASVLAELAATLAWDTVEVMVTGLDGVSRTVTLTAPTHPLRLLWLTTWAELGHHWLESAGDVSRQAVAGAGVTLIGITPLGFPFAVPVSGGRLTIAAADITPYWGVCLPTDTPDPQDLIAGLRRALRVPERMAGAHPIPAPVLADRVERYLRQHPYVSTLVISAVNAGRGGQLADMLVELQRRKHLADIRYDIRLFAMDETAAATGAALASLMRDEWSSAAGAEAFGIRQASGLIPKLAVAVLPLGEFRAVTEERPSHLTFLFDAFSGETFGAAPGGFMPGTLPVHGLVQDIDIRYVEDDEGVSWHKRPRHGRAVGFAGGEEACDLLAVLPETISAAVAAVATGQVGAGLVPQVTLGLSPADGALLHQAHRSSDWVITVDRTLGMEYFDSPGSLRRPDYVIDFEGSVADGGLGHHLVISSRSVDELSALLAPVIKQHGLAVDDRHVGTFFDQLRLLSGRLAFKLASATATQRTEVLGLALARLYLGYQGAIDSQVIVPLDDHLEFYRDARRTAQELGEAVSLQRTDLALWSLDARRRTITCRLVEVKCYSEVRGVSVFENLKSRIAEQLARSQEVLRDRFDPALELGDRPDRAVRNAELAGMLRFYLDRAVRHQTMRRDAADEASWLLGNLDGGHYRLQFTKTGLIFDLSGTGESPSADGGIEYHRIGRDFIEELLAVMPTDPLLAAEDAACSLSSLDVSLPRLEDAAFRAPERSHETPAVPETASPDASSDDLGEVVAVVGRMEQDTATSTGTGTSEAMPEPSPLPEPELRLLVAENTVGDGAAAAAESSATVEQVAGESSGVAAVVRPPQVFLGTSQPSPQYGALGQDTLGRTVALDLNETHTISLFGVQGGGKSYTLGSVIEAATMPAPPVNQLPRPLATIVFHYSPTLDYEPEFTSMVAANTDPSQVHDLVSRYGGTPGGLADVVILVPADQLGQRQREHPELTVLPLKFGSGELGSAHWRFLMGAVGNQSTYIRQLQRIMKAHRGDLRLDVIRDGVAGSGMPDNLKQLAQQRLDLAAEYIDDSVSIKDVVRPGRMIIVDLRDEFIEKDEALGLFVVLMQLFADAQRERFNKLVVFDEAHKYIDSPDLVDGLVESVREMRHKGMSVLVASQDPPSVPIKLIELSDVVILHKFNSPAWLRHMQKAVVSLADLTPAKMASLAPGEAYVWSSKSTDPDFTRGSVRLRLRPRITRHGGATKTAV